MELIIDNDENLDLDKFCNWLIEKIRTYLIANIDDRKISRFDDQINRSIKWQFPNKFISAKNILIASTYHLNWEKYNSRYTIYLDNNELIPQTYAKFIDIINLITYGNLYLQGYDIYDKTLKHFADNLFIYYQEYLEE